MNPTSATSSGFNFRGSPRNFGTLYVKPGAFARLKPGDLIKIEGDLIIIVSVYTEINHNTGRYPDGLAMFVDVMQQRKMMKYQLHEFDVIEPPV